jgi:hypothetical protein
VEGGALMDPSFAKRGWGDFKTSRAIFGLVIPHFSTILGAFSKSTLHLPFGIILKTRKYF